MRQNAAEKRRRTGRYRPRQANMNTAVSAKAAASGNSEFRPSRLAWPTRSGIRAEARTTDRKHSEMSTNRDDNGTLRNAANMETPPPSACAGNGSGSVIPRHVDDTDTIATKGAREAPS